MQFPFITAALAPCLNLPGIKDAQLRLTPDVLAGMFLGEITNWNDPKVAEHNPGLALPDLAVMPISRTEVSTVTLVFTTYLSQVSDV